MTDRRGGPYTRPAHEGDEMMDKVFSADAYCAWLRSQARMKRPYWYGTCFQKCTEALLKRKTEQYATTSPEHYTEARMSRYRADIAAGQICGDCVGGAIKGAAWTLLSTEPWKYASHGVQDRSADGMYEWCKSLGAENGKIDTIPDRPGVAVRMKGHVGVYVGGGDVVEWRGFAYGCVVTRLDQRPWTDWYELPWVTYAEGQNSPVRKTLKNGMSGPAVKELQQKLLDLGYYLGRWGADGDFGAATENAVMAFQDQHSLTVDGIVGPKTWAALDGENTPHREPKYTITIRGVDQTEMEAMKVRWPHCEVTEE